jgi:hypothetical protein
MYTVPPARAWRPAVVSRLARTLGHTNRPLAQRHMSKKKRAPDTVLPTSMEEHLDQVTDPRGHEEELASANALLANFVHALSAGRQPTSTLTQVQEAFGVLGTFAGYPQEAHEAEMYLESSHAASSYMTVAKILPSCIEDMNNRIEKRIALLSVQEKIEASTQGTRIDDTEIPF